MVVKISAKKTKKKERRRISFFLLSFSVGVLLVFLRSGFVVNFAKKKWNEGIVLGSGQLLRVSHHKTFNNIAKLLRRVSRLLLASACALNSFLFVASNFLKLAFFSTALDICSFQR
jgi:hypothetical protein